MSVMLDVIGAALLVGMLMLTILNVNVNMTLETFKSRAHRLTYVRILTLSPFSRRPLELIRRGGPSLTSSYLII